MPKSIILIFCFLGVQFSASAQINYSVSGYVINSKTKEPIPFANVYLEGSTLGTQTNESGYFAIRNVPAGFFKLVASFVGYSSKITNLIISDTDKKINLTLTEDVKLLNEVNVIGSRDNEWEKQYKVFEKAFLGSKLNKKEVKVLNPQVIDFEKTTVGLNAKSDNEIIIVNESLGYKITYSLKDFSLNNTTTSFTGLAKYEELTTTDTKRLDAWEKNRINNYYGSLRHFLNALIDNNLEQEGFEAYFLNTNYVNTSGNKDLFYNITTGRHTKLKTEEIIKKISETSYSLTTDNPIEIIYKKKRLNRSVFPDAPHPYSILIKKSTVIFSENGTLENPFSIELKGDMGEPSLANWLPVNYVPEPLEKLDKNDPSKLLQRNFETVVARDQQQKVYLEIDNSIYTSNDTLEFRATVVDATSNLPLYESQKVFVELQNDNKQIMVNTVLKTNSHGISKSFLLLPDSLSSGNYTLVAFTNWMRNFENPIVFQKQIIISNSKNKKELAISKNEELQVEFFPEGGVLLYNIPTKVSVKVCSNNGKAIEGNLVYDSGKIIKKVVTNKHGIGCFKLSPDKENTVSLQIGEKSFSLPTPKDIGYALSVNNFGEDSIKVKVVHLTDKVNIRIKICVLLQSSGFIYENLTYSTRSDIIQFSIDKSKLPTGIYQLVVFDEVGKLQAERLIFITKKESDFNSYLQFTSELKYKVEYDEAYFSDKNSDNAKQLDHELITQKWNRYDWAEMSKIRRKVTYNFEPNDGLSFEGIATVIYSKKKALKRGYVTIIPHDKTQSVIKTRTNRKGKFEFINQDFSGTPSFLIKTQNRREQEVMSAIEMYRKDVSAVFSQSNIAFLGYKKKQEITSPKMEVLISKKMELSEMNNEFLYGKPDGVIYVDLKSPGNNVIEMINGKIPGIRIIESNGGYEYRTRAMNINGNNIPPLFLLDGVTFEAPINNSGPLMTLTRNDIERIEYVTGSNASMYGVRAAGGLVSIVTNRGNKRPSLVKKVNIATLEGFGEK